MVERGGLENHCRHCLPGVRIPPPPLHPMRFATVATLLVLLQATAVKAQLQYLVYEPAVRPAGIRYLVHKTPHFDVIFESGRVLEAVEAAEILERELAKTQAFVGDPRKMRMPVVLNAYNDRSNGYVHTLPFRQEIEIPQIKGDLLSAHYTSWMQAVVPHELVHAVQAQAGGRFGIGTIVDWVAPDLARSINLALPSGLNEGAAVYYESRVEANAGRLNDARFRMKMEAAGEASQSWSVAQMFEAPAYTWPRSRHYIGGAHFFAWQARRDNGAFYSRMRGRVWRFPFRSTGFELRATTGKSPGQLIEAFFKDLREASARRIDGQDDRAPLQVISGRKGVTHRRPHWANDSTLMVYKTGYDVISGLYAVNSRTGDTQRIHAVRLPEDAWFSVKHEKVLYSRYLRDVFVPTQWVAEAFELSLPTRRVRRLTNGGRVFAPVQVGKSIWAAKNEGQYTTLSLITEGGSVEPLRPEEQVSLIQIAPAPTSNETALLVRSNGEQGIFRFDQSGDSSSALEPWIVLPGTAIREIAWSPNGRYLLYTADLHGTSNVYSYDLQHNRTTQLTDVRYGALDPQVSPDGSTLAFVSYGHERHDLVSVPFDPESAPEIVMPDSGTVAPILPLEETPDNFITEPYSLSGRLSPRLLVPVLHYDYESPGRKLGFGGGVLMMGSDPLRRLTYTVQASYLSHRLWSSFSLSTMLGVIKASAYAYRRPGTVTAAVRDSEGGIHNLIYGRTRENVGLRFRLPLFLESGVRSTTGAITMGVGAGQKSWFSVDEKPVPVYPETGESLANRVGFTYVNAGAAFNIRLMQNLRDIWPHRGATVSVSAYSDLWHERNQERRALLGRAALYWSPSRRAHTGLRLGASVLSQNSPNVYDAFLVLPRSYEDAYIGTGQIVKADAEILQPLWFIDDGFLDLPMYFKVLYVFGFFEEVVHSDTPDLQNTRAVGAGLGLEWRLMHYLDLDLRIGLAFPDAGGLKLTFH